MDTRIKIKDKEFELFIPEQEIQKRVKELAINISLEYNSKELVIVPLLDGAFLFASDLIRELTIPCHVSFIKTKSYEGTESSGKVKSLLGLDISVENKHVVLVDDIVDTGLTMYSVLEEIKNRGAVSISIATLLFKPDSLACSLELSYVGYTIPSRFVVGYGLDYDGLGRNYKDIYTLKF